MRDSSTCRVSTMWSCAALACSLTACASMPRHDALPSFEPIAGYFRPDPAHAADANRFRSPLIFNDGSRVASAAQWPARRREILNTWHGLMGRWPPRLQPPGAKTLKIEKRDGFALHRLDLQTDAENRTPANLLIPDGPGPFPAVLVVYYEAETAIGRGKPLRDFALQLTKRGFVTLAMGKHPAEYYPDKTGIRLQPLSYCAYIAANAGEYLAALPQVDAKRIGIVGHSYGGKWAMFASCLNERFACAAWSDGGIVFNEKRPNVNYWEPWYLGYEYGKPPRKPGVISPERPRTGAYQKMIAAGRDLHELHALMAPRPFLVSGGSEDPPSQWAALRHSIEVNRLLGATNRVAMTNRPTHAPTAESNEILYLFFEHFLKHGGVLMR